MTQQPPRPPQPGQPGAFRLELPANLAATYANAAIVSHTHSEIILDFVQVMPNDPRARVQRRIVLTPVNAKLLLQALETNLKRYEEKHGEIATPPTLADQLFGTIRVGDKDEPTDE